MKKRIEWYDILIVIGIIMIIGWALLKSLNIIHSPTWIEMIPYFGVGATLAGAVYKLGEVMQIIRSIKKDVERLTEKISPIERRLDKLDYEINLIVSGKLKI